VERQRTTQSRKLSPEEFQKFLELIDSLELEDITVMKMSFELLSPLEEGTVAIKIGERAGSPQRKGEKLEIPQAFAITVEQKEEEKLRFRVEYLLTFSVARDETVSQALEYEGVTRFFLEQQVPKLVWPFLREDFHFACSKLGLRPITLKLRR
jgi:hypothetical protein